MYHYLIIICTIHQFYIIIELINFVYKNSIKINQLQ